jgi:threonine aldolase
VESNIVIFTVPDPDRFVDELAHAGVEVSRVGPTLIRMVTHLDVDRAGCERARAAAREALGS